MKGNLKNISIIMNEDRRVNNNNYYYYSTVNNSFILANDIRNNYGKVQLNKSNNL